MNRVKLVDIKAMAEQARERLWALSGSIGREPKVFLHWTAGHYGQTFNDYHICIDKNGEIYAHENLADILPHTWHQNTGAVAVSLCCCAFASTVTLGDEPPTDAQVETMAQVVAVLCQGLWLTCDYDHVRTHAEQADIDDYGPATTCERWDLWFLKDDKARGSGGDILRGKAKWYMDNGVGV